MARVTVEDCIKHVPNRFDLVLVAANRARKLDRGEAESVLSIDNDKHTVVALREIAENNYQQVEQQTSSDSEQASTATDFDE